MFIQSVQRTGAAAAVEKALSPPYLHRSPVFHSNNSLRVHLHLLETARDLNLTLQDNVRPKYITAHRELRWAASNMWFMAPELSHLSPRFRSGCK